jgi:hypothetical protein
MPNRLIAGPVRQARPISPALAVADRRPFLGRTHAYAKLPEERRHFRINPAMFDLVLLDITHDTQRNSDVLTGDIVRFLSLCMNLQLGAAQVEVLCLRGSPGSKMSRALKRNLSRCAVAKAKWL